MHTNPQSGSHGERETRLDRRLNDIGWGLLLMLTGVIWLLPAATVPPGAWLFGVGAILLGINAVRLANHLAASGFSTVLGIAALVAATSQAWRTDPPLVPIFLLIIGASLIAKPLLTKTT